MTNGGTAAKEELIHAALLHPEFLVLSGGAPSVTYCQGVPWSGAHVNANGDLSVDLRSDMAAESRAKIVYEYLMKFTDDPLVRETLGFLMTREIAHFQMFGAALDTIQPNFPPGVLAETQGEIERQPEGTKLTADKVTKLDSELSQVRSQEVKSATPEGAQQWSAYPQATVAASGSSGGRE